MNKAIITVVGKKRHSGNYRKGMYLSGREPCKHPDISQTMYRGYFNMMMIVDV